MDVGQEMVFAAEIIAGSDSAIGTPMTYDFYRSEMHGLSPGRLADLCAAGKHV